MKKALSTILLIVITLGLVACGGNQQDDVLGGDYDNQDDVPGRNPTGNPLAEYQASIAVQSYDDLIRAWNIHVQNNEDGRYNKYYTFNGGIGSYKPLYYFTAYNAWIVPTADIETYFSKVNNFSLVTMLIDSREEYCSCSSTRHDVFSKLPDEYKSYDKYPFISIEKKHSFTETIIDIEDKSCISLAREYDLGGYYTYDFEYNGVEAFRITSCHRLSEGDFDALFDRIVILN